MEWTIADARLHLDEVLARAAAEGPQTIRQDDTTVYVVSEKPSQSPSLKDKLSFVEFLLNGPSLDGLDLERRSSGIRDPEL